MNSKSLVNTFSKLSLLPITEYNFESEKLLQMTGKLVLVGVLSLEDQNEKIREESWEILKYTLKEVAARLPKEYNYATIDYEGAKEILEK